MLKYLLNFLPTLHLKQLRGFLISLCIIISFCLASIFIYLDKHTTDLMQQRVKEQAIAYLDLINHTKVWNFDNGGVFVEKSHNVQSNVYLKQLGIDPDLQCKDGKTLTVRNHAIMISEISRISEKHDGGVTFRIASQWPLDPDNILDSFERDGITSLTSKNREHFNVVQRSGKSYFRYLAPLFAEPSCLGCHRGLPIRSGDILGVVSISIPIDNLIKETRTSRVIIFLSAIFSIGLLMTAVYFLTLRLAIALDKAQHQLQTQALTDELTGLSNRRQVMTRLEQEFQRAVRVREPICVISLDIDHFKKVNDTYGHMFGDQVLRKVAERMQSCLRTYDTVGRVGGEEFLIVAPASPAEEAISLAERVIDSISSEPMVDGNTSITVTASAGVAVIGLNDAEADDLLRRADRSLYEAKASGRNRVAGP
jgi:diguanylate cyclase (GGDEF)-like protein